MERLRILNKTTRVAKVAASVAIAASLAGCAGRSSSDISAEQQSNNNKQFKVSLMAGFDGLGGFHAINCYTNPKPIMEVIDGEAEVVFPGLADCYDQNNAPLGPSNRAELGISETNPVRDMEVEIKDTYGITVLPTHGEQTGASKSASEVIAGEPYKVQIHQGFSQGLGGSLINIDCYTGAEPTKTVISGETETVEFPGTTYCYGDTQEIGVSEGVPVANLDVTTNYDAKFSVVDDLLPTSTPSSK